MAWAREMSLTGNFVDAATALRIGIANHVVPHEELLPFTMRLAAAIAEADRAMVATMREDWDATSGIPVREARRLHVETARDAGYAGQASADGIAARRDAVLDRSRAQRHGLPTHGIARRVRLGHYGYGESEEILAEALYPYPGDLVVGTKAGFRPGKIEPGKTSLPPLGHPGHIKEECDRSLRHLRLDHIDLYQVHVPDPRVPWVLAHCTCGSPAETR
jgi:Aldo/keto reductase family/Enoyl-CoA hydratase/isomerase